MNESLPRPGVGDAAQHETALAREARRNRLCELRQSTRFEEWRRLTLALGQEDCLLLADEVAARLAESRAVSMAKALLSNAQRAEDTAEDSDDRWVNPLLPLAQPPAQFHGALTSAAADAD